MTMRFLVKLLKKPSMIFSTSKFEKRGFQISSIFNGLQPSKMSVHPCTVRSLLKNRVFQQTAGTLFLVFVLGACGESGPRFSITNTEVIAPAPGRTVSVAYLIIENHRDEPLTISHISSPQFASVEMHETVLNNGVARMRALSSVTVESNASMEFKPGGKHLMLFSPVKALIPGKPVALHIQLASGDISIVETTLKTRHLTD